MDSPPVVEKSLGQNSVSPQKNVGVAWGEMSNLVLPQNETDVTSKTTLEAYRAIAVPELWIYDGSELGIHWFEPGTVESESGELGQYVRAATSRIFPGIPVGQWVPEAIARAWVVGTVQALEEFELLEQQPRALCET